MILDRWLPPPVGPGPRSSKLAEGSSYALWVLHLPRTRVSEIRQDAPRAGRPGDARLCFPPTRRGGRRSRRASRSRYPDRFDWRSASGNRLPGLPCHDEPSFVSRVGAFLRFSVDAKKTENVAPFKKGGLGRPGTTRHFRPQAVLCHGGSRRGHGALSGRSTVDEHAAQRGPRNPATPARRSRPIDGNATLTTVASRSTIASPSTVNNRT